MLAHEHVVSVKVFPSSKKEKVVVLASDSFEIYVREPAQNNMANTRVRECVAAHFEVALNRVTIKTGHRARKKLLGVLRD